MKSVCERTAAGGISRAIPFRAHGMTYRGARVRDFAPWNPTYPS